MSGVRTLYVRTSSPTVAQEVRDHRAFREMGKITLSSQGSPEDPSLVKLRIPTDMLDGETGIFGDGQGKLMDESGTGRQLWQVEPSAIKPEWITGSRRMLLTVGLLSPHIQHGGVGDPYVLATLRDQGWKGFRGSPPVCLQVSGDMAVVTDGNNRIAAARDLGLAGVPTLIVFDADPLLVHPIGTPVADHLMALLTRTTIGSRAR